jgi:hypothetical protein
VQREREPQQHVAERRDADGGDDQADVTNAERGHAASVRGDRESTANPA